MKCRLAVISKNPIPYHIPLFRCIDKSHINSVVLYLDKIGVKPVIDKEFKVSVIWDIPLLGGYTHKFIRNYSLNPYGGFLSRINPALFVEVRKKNYDYLLIQGYENISCWFSLLAAKLSGVKVIWRGEATLRDNDDNLSIKSKLKRLLLSFYFRNCDAIMYSCSGNRKYLQYYGVSGNKLFPIPCAVDNDYFRAERKRYIENIDQIKQELGISLTDLVVLFSARFTDRKKPMDLLKAIALIPENNITVLFVGDGPQKDDMDAYAKRKHIKAVFTGFQNQSAISRYYSIADVAVVISDYDPSPKALNEAMNFKLPIIATDVLGTTSDLVRHGENGFVCKVGDVEAISKSIDYICKNRIAAKSMGESSYEIVAEWNYSRDVYWLKKAMESLDDHI